MKMKIAIAILFLIVPVLSQAFTLTATISNAAGNVNSWVWPTGTFIVGDHQCYSTAFATLESVPSNIDSFTITGSIAGDKTRFTWTPPVERIDGSPMANSEISEFRIYCQDVTPPPPPPDSPPLAPTGLGVS